MGGAKLSECFKRVVLNIPNVSQHSECLERSVVLNSPGMFRTAAAKPSECLERGFYIFRMFRTVGAKHSECFERVVLNIPMVSTHSECLEFGLLSIRNV